MAKMRFFALLACSLAAAGAAPAGEIGDKPETAGTARVLGTIVQATEPDELRYLILKPLTDRYADAKGIEVTQAEEQAYVEHLQATMEEDRKHKTERRDELTQKLASPGLSEEERESLSSELDTLQGFLATLDEMAQGAAEAPEETAAARGEVAEAFIRQWKINRALFDDYGGRVIFQQGGPEPLDAYRKFLEERKKTGDFEILDKDLEEGFWRYYTTESIHSFYEPGSEEEARALHTPWWQADQ